MESLVEVLEWDTNFFQKNISRINGIQINKENQGLLFDYLKANNVDLAYYFNQTPIDSELKNNDYTISLVDRKTTYHKVIDSNNSSHNSVVSYPRKYPEPIILDLAVQSGIYSRFSVDPRFGNDNYQRLYREWMINSVNGKVAKKVLVYYDKDAIKGIVTLGEKNLVADIGLIAVDTKYRGTGIGKELLRSAEIWFAKNTTYNSIQVVTQGVNLPACRLYESSNFEVQKVEYVYHFWKKRR